VHLNYYANLLHGAIIFPQNFFYGPKHGTGLQDRLALNQPSRLAKGRPTKAVTEAAARITKKTEKGRKK